ncbi:MAG: ubiquinol-cytochrome c reductase iron-sulfur subunit [Candidatus Margulisiibacteriota bacterium]
MGIGDRRFTRREFLSLSIFASFAVAASSGLYTVFKYLYPAQETPLQAGEKIMVAELNDLPSGSTFIFRYRNKPSILINSKTGITALSLVCTHLGCVVKWDPVKNILICPCHAGIFDASGRVISGPPPAPLPKLNVTVKERKIYVGEG